MPGKEEIADALRGILEKTLKVDPALIRPDANLKDELKLDSLDMIEVVYEVEDRFDVQIPEDSIKDIRTFQQVVDGLHRALEAKAK